MKLNSITQKVHDEALKMGMEVSIVSKYIL